MKFRISRYKRRRLEGRLWEALFFVVVVGVAVVLVQLITFLSAPTVIRSR